VRGLHRVAWLRKRVGASPQLFSPLPAGSGQRHLALCIEIREIEKQLIGHCHDIGDVLQRRLDADRRRKR
jgi:hypothetical protein